MKVPLKLAVERIKSDPLNVNNLRMSLDCWKRGDRGESLTEIEEEQAELFEELLMEAVRADTLLAFAKQVERTGQKQKFRLIDRIIQEAPKYETKAEVERAVERKYGKWGKRTWQEAWKEFFREH